MDSWYALYTRPQHERKVFEELTSHGMEAFFPTFKSERRWKDRRKTIDEPLFKSYVFVRVAAERYHRALQPYGALSVVTFDGRPAEIPASEVEGIRRLVTSTLPFNPHPYLTTGRRVSIRSGPLKGCEGILLKIKGQGRFVLSVDLLQRSVAVEVDAKCVQPV